MIKNLFLVALGGGVGSMLRYLCSVIMTRMHPYNFPLATLLVNITGCLLIGVLIGLSERYDWMDKELRLLLITGFCGGFTTFSAFSAENLSLLEAGNYFSFGVYVVGSVVLGLVGVWLGIALIRL